MRSLKSVWLSMRAFVVRYPALLSGYFIYAYLFLCIIRFFVLVKTGEASLLRVYETFVAVPFLWLLAFSFVKVIEIRSRLHEAETRALEVRQELEHKHLQLDTLHEVIRGLMDVVNNPLEMILLKAESLKEGAADQMRAEAIIGEIKTAARSISEALARFNRSEEYRVEHIAGGTTTFAVPPDEPPS